MFRAPVGGLKIRGALFEPYLTLPKISIKLYCKNTNETQPRFLHNFFIINVCK